MKTLVVGLGSPFGADQVGWMIIDELREKNVPSVTLFKSKSDGSDWFHEINHHQQIVFIDALYTNTLLSNDYAERIIELGEDDIANNSNIEKETNKSTHSISLSDSISLARSIGVLNIPVRVYAIPIDEMKFTKDIDINIESEVKNIIPEVINKLCYC